MSDGEGASKISDDAVVHALIDIIHRTGALTFEFRVSEPDEEHEDGPVVCIALAMHHLDQQGRPVKRGTSGSVTKWSAAGGMDPRAACLALAEQLLDGGRCKHCHRPTGVTLDVGAMPAEQMVCWYRFDGTRFVQGCRTKLTLGRQRL